MLGKLLGKKSGFYLELSEDEIAAIPSAPATPAAKAAVPQAQPAAAAKAPAAKAPAATTTAKASTTAAPAAAVTSSISDSQELIRTALSAAANKPAPVVEPPAQTFADYVPKPVMSRRRPGPSMSSFKTMAKEMRASKSGF